MIEFFFLEAGFNELLFAGGIYLATSLTTIIFWLGRPRYYKAKFSIAENLQRITFLLVLFLYDLGTLLLCAFVFVRYVPEDLLTDGFSENFWLGFEASFLTVHILAYSVRLHLFENR